jgi:tryptophan synthase alpha chain
VADGVVQGASVVRRLLEGGPDAVGEYVAEVRAAIDASSTPPRRLPPPPKR